MVCDGLIGVATIDVERIDTEERGASVAWSTSQLAELAGTTLKAVRHYHQVGLLDEPERAANGYKKYGVPHLVRLLQIKRLVDLGVPLAQIATIGQAEDGPEEALKLLDAELAQSIEKLQRVRAELAVILRHRAPAELPSGFSSVGRDLSEADRSLIMIYSRIFDDASMDDLRTMMQRAPRTAEDREFDALAADADEATRRDLAERFAPQIRSMQEQYPWMRGPGLTARRGAASAQSTVVQAMADLYNPAQLDVMRRAMEIIQEDER